MRNKRGFSFSVTIASFSFLLLCCGPAFAQQPMPQPPPPDIKNQPTLDQSDNSNSSEDASSLEHPVAVTTTAPSIRQTTSAGFLLPSISPLRWGPLYVSYVQYSEILDQGNSFSGVGNLDVTATQFSAGLVFDKQFRRARLAVQYVPRVTILNGQVFSNFANQDTGVDIAFAITPRLTLDLSNHFVYYRSSDYFVDLFLSSDPVSGLTLQNNFIRTPGTWLSDSTTAAFTYTLSARTRIILAPNYLYANTSGQTFATVFPTVNEYGVNASVTHDLTANSNVSLLYIDQTDDFPGSTYKTTYQSLEAGYSHSLKGGWNFSGSFGFITANFQSGRTWSEAGSMSVVKRFRRSQAAIAYYRGHTFAGYISQQLSDRVDASYQQYLGRRWTLGGGVGYLRDIETGNGIWGKYGEANLSFGLTSSVSLFGNYVYQWQAANNNLIFTGNTNFLRCGIQWTAHAPYPR
jgi:hypothetical protein